MPSYVYNLNARITIRIKGVQGVVIENFPCTRKLILSLSPHHTFCKISYVLYR